MPRSINSFDVFDTLIARRSGEPRAVLIQLEACANLTGLARHRVAADQTLGAKGHPYDLQAIWHEVGRTLGLDAATIARLMDLEVGIEHEEVLGIAENLALVRDGDLLVSDSYLPRHIILSLLRKAGLRKTVALVVTNAGKFQGWIWPELLKHAIIGQHLGDNVHSDGKTASAAGIKAIIYTGGHPTPIEKLLAEAGLTPLAKLVREVRLANPMSSSRPGERTLWNLSCQLNFPLLLLASLELEQQARHSGVNELLFISRDCLMWHRLFARLFPKQIARYLFTSRRCLLKPTESYRAYFRSVWRLDSLIIDLTSTGLSWSRFFAGLQGRGKLYCIGHIDNYNYLDNTPINLENVEIRSVFRASELGASFNKNLEMLNYGPHPVVEDVRCLPSGAALPVLAESLEYPAAFPEAAHAAFEKCAETLDHYPRVVDFNQDLRKDLIRKLVQLICADRRLPAIFVDHQATDAAYVQSILREAE